MPILLLMNLAGIIALILTIAGILPLSPAELASGRSMFEIKAILGFFCGILTIMFVGALYGYIDQRKVDRGEKSSSGVAGI